MKKHCRFCLNKFEAKRKTAQFCSEACKQRNKRGISATAGMSPEEIRDYKRLEMELNLDNLPVIDSDVPVENPVTGPGVEKLFSAIRKEKTAEKIKNGWELSDKEEDALITDVPEEDVLTRIRKGMRVNVRLTELKQYYPYDNMYHFVHVCYIPTKEEYEEALITYQTYEDQFSITNKEHAKALAITSTQCMCSFCGERYGSMQGRCPLYCKYCKTAPQRAAVAVANHARNIIAYYKAHHKEFEMYDCPICNVKI